MATPKKPAFARRPVPRASTPTAVPIPKGIPDTPGGLPLPTGQVLTKNTQDQLEAVGWKEGDPIPSDLPQIIQEIREEIDKGYDEAVDELAKTPRSNKPKKVMDIRDMPPGYREEIAKVMSDHKASVEARAAEAAAGPSRPSSNPSILAAQQASQRAAAEGEAMRARAAAGLPTATLVDDTPQAQPVPSLPPGVTLPPGTQLGGVSGAPIMQLPPEPPPPPPPEAPAVAPDAEPDPEPPLTAGGLDNTDKCPRCQFDRNMAFTAKPSARDVEIFTVGMLAMERFRKTYELMGGKLKITYRNLTAVESQMLFKQLGYDAENGELVGNGEYFLKLQGYRLALGVEKIESATAVLVEVPPLMELGWEPLVKGEKSTAVAALYKWFIEEGLPNESMIRVAAQNHRHFQRIVESLEAMTSEPDFWNGTEPQP